MKLNDSLKTDQKELIYFFSEVAVTGKSELTRFKLLIQNEIAKICSLKNSNLDELLNFINDNNDSAKPKKLKKKVKKVKEEFSDIFENNTTNSSYDKEVEEFKNFLCKNSISRNNINKIIPTFSQEWLQNMKL